MHGVDELARRLPSLIDVVAAMATTASAIDPSVVRGLEYYTGPVYEVELLLETKDEKGRPVRFGSVGGGGRYDGLVSRFRGEPVPATGFSIGVSRLQAALTLIGKLDGKPAPGPVVVTVFDRDRIADYQRMVAGAAQRRHPRRALSRQPEEFRQPDEICRQARLALRRHPGRRREGQGRGADQGPDPRRRDRRPVARTATTTCKKQAEAQFAVPESELVDGVRKVLARHDIRWS